MDSDALIVQRWLVSSIQVPTGDFDRFIIVHARPAASPSDEEQQIQIKYMDDNVFMTVNQNLCTYTILIEWITKNRNVTMRTLSDSGYVYQAHFSTGI